VRGRRSVLIGSIIGLLYLGPHCGVALAASPCAKIEQKYDRYKICIDDFANFSCRSSQSVASYKQCFREKSRTMFLADGEPVPKGPNYPLCDYDDPKNSFRCTNKGEDFTGAGDTWCNRITENTIKICEGDPPNYKCSTKSCPQGSSCVSLYECGSKPRWSHGAE
jgi:hypothetical protein